MNDTIVQAVQEKILNEKDRRIIRCVKCGHFLMELLSNYCIVKVLCRQSECKTYNHIKICGEKMEISLEEKRDIVRA